MRVTAETKSATRQRILEAAEKLFTTRGFEACTTREIAEAAGIATGTLFNYFVSKEAVLACLAVEAVGEVQTDAGGSLEEDLFSFVAAGLRKLKGLRKHLPALLETALHPLAGAAGDDAQALKQVHLETVARLVRDRGLGELSPVAVQLYWTLYIGVLMFWANDRSPRQEDTLALLDDSLSMFAGWLQRGSDPSSTSQKGRVE